jgi:hypothetical protein
MKSNGEDDKGMTNTSKHLIYIRKIWVSKSRKIVKDGKRVGGEN